MSAAVTANDYALARGAWNYTGRTLAALKAWRRRRGLGDDPELDTLAGDWGAQGRALFLREPPRGDGLGWLFLIPWVIGGAAAIYGAFVTKQAIDVKRIEAERAEEILTRVDKGELTPAQAQSLLTTAGTASAGRPILQQILGVSPLMLATLAGAWVFRRPLMRMLKGRA